MKDTIYQKEQRLNPVWFWISSVPVDVFLILTIINLSGDSDNLILSVIAIVFLSMFLVFDILLFFFLKLKVSIDFEFLYISLKPLSNLKIPINEISFYEIVSFRPLRDFGGYGIRYSFRKKEAGYFLKGNTGVRIYYPLSKKLIVGTEDPRLFINAIQYAQQRRKILSEMK